MDDETSHYIEVRRAKLERLGVLDKQAARFGYDVPPHIEMERVNLRAELGVVETAIASPASSQVGDEIGPGGRFAVNYQQNREIKQSIAKLANDFEMFVKASEAWRQMHGQWILIIGIVVVVILVAMAVIVGFLAARGGI